LKIIRVTVILDALPQTMRSLEAKGFSLIELLFVAAIIATLSAIAIAQVMRARMSANETSAIASLRAINEAEQTYAQGCLGFAPNLLELRAAGNFISPDLASGNSVAKSGYKVVVAAAAGGVPVPAPPQNCTGTTTGYYATAVPLSVGASGQRAFATDNSHTIYYDVTGVPPPDPIPPGTLTIQ
jgi:type IV pilus assembly protein PilA